MIFQLNLELSSRHTNTLSRFSRQGVALHAQTGRSVVNVDAVSVLPLAAKRTVQASVNDFSSRQKQRQKRDNK